jgi:hypothetical protein
MRRVIVGLFLVAFCFSALGCQEDPNAGAKADPPAKGSKPGGRALPSGVPPAKSE